MKKRFTKKELEILKTLWNSAAPVIASEIAKANNALNLNTVHACLIVSKMADAVIEANQGATDEEYYEAETAVEAEEAVEE